MVIADNLSQYVSFVYGNMSEMSGPNLFAATVLFAVQLYMDFRAAATSCWARRASWAMT